jgi:hypothetical protein
MITEKKIKKLFTLNPIHPRQGQTIPKGWDAKSLAYNFREEVRAAGLPKGRIMARRYSCRGLLEGEIGEGGDAVRM